jgi:DNA-binding LytR/AlgR family response regulator
MNVIIIEDEPLAQAKLESMLKKLDSKLRVVARLGSVKESLSWLKTNAQPDLAFVDIQLSDDHSFEIFRSHAVSCPVVFTTAYDRYLLESFEFNAIDYLLKPITEDKLKRALAKVATLEKHFLQSAIQQLLHHDKKPAKKRILAKKGSEFTAIEQDEIAYFYTDQKIVFLRDTAGNRFMVDQNLAELESSLDSESFFRLNRKIIAHRKGIDRFKSEQGKIKVHLKPGLAEEIYVSKEGAPAFRKWIEDSQ